MEQDIKNLQEIINLCNEELDNEDENVTAVLDLVDLKSLKALSAVSADSLDSKAAILNRSLPSDILGWGKPRDVGNCAIYYYPATLDHESLSLSAWFLASESDLPA